jgi:aldehyde:ferredoxin oxidoreductase
MYGFFNRLLIIDTELRTFQIEDLPDEVLRRGLGGKGLGSYLLRQYNPPRVEALAPENHLIFATGPITGSKIYGSCRYGAYSKSPQTGFYSESYSGGWVPEAISRTGFDAVMVTGASAEPVVLEVNENGAVFHEAEDLWGAETYRAEDEIINRWGAKTKGLEKSGAVVIGPAGENLVRFAVMENDKWRSAGRTGLGAVLGSKKVKGLVFNGSKQRDWADRGAMDDFVRGIKERGQTDAGVRAYKTLGTPMMVALMNKVGCFPTRYWSQGHYDQWEKIAAPAMQEKCEVRSHACLRCLMACGKLSTVKGGRHKGLTIEGPEYETLYAFGGLCLIDSIEEICYLNNVCDRLGMDTITGGNLCAFTVEASLRGKIRDRYEYGNPDHMADILNKIAKREGIGQVLAEGIIGASQEWGLEELAVHVKGMEPAGYDPRVLKGTGLGYAVSDRGACHLRATFYKPEISGMIPPDQIDKKADLFVEFEDRLTVFDTLVLCRFYRDLYQYPELGKIVECTTGLSLSADDFRAMAAVVTDDTRRFNVQEGLTAEHDNLPRRFYDEPLSSGHSITEAELLSMRSDYYRIRGWSEEGLPPAEV